MLQKIPTKEWYGDDVSSPLRCLTYVHSARMPPNANLLGAELAWEKNQEANMVSNGLNLKHARLARKWSEG